MIWIFLSILAGLGDATTWAFMKKVKGISGFSGAFLRFLFAVPILAFSLLFFELESISSMYWLVMVVNAVGIFFANYFIFKAAQVSDISKSMPLITMTPLFLLLTSLVMVDQFPTVFGLFGILFIVLGAYFLNISRAHEGIFEPLKLLLKKKGPRYILFAALIYSVTANTTKIGIDMTNPGFFTFSNYLLVSIILFPFVYRKIDFSVFKKNFKYCVGMGIATGVMMLSVALALTRGLVPYVISLKRTNALFSVLYGFLWFKEADIKESLLGAALMFIGVVLISVF